MNSDLVEIIIGSLDVKRVLARGLFFATVTGAGGAPPTVVVHDGGIMVHVWLFSCGNEWNLS